MLTRLHVVTRVGDEYDALVDERNRWRVVGQGSTRAWGVASMLASEARIQILLHGTPSQPDAEQPYAHAVVRALPGSYIVSPSKIETLDDRPNVQY